MRRSAPVGAYKKDSIVRYQVVEFKDALLVVEAIEILTIGPFDNDGPKQTFLPASCSDGHCSLWLYVAVVIEMLLRHVACWSLRDAMTPHIVTDVLGMANWSRG